MNGMNRWQNQHELGIGTIDLLPRNLSEVELLPGMRNHMIFEHESRELEIVQSAFDAGHYCFGFLLEDDIGFWQREERARRKREGIEGGTEADILASAAGEGAYRPSLAGIVRDAYEDEMEENPYLRHGVLVQVIRWHQNNVECKLVYQVMGSVEVVHMTSKEPRFQAVVKHSTAPRKAVDVERCRELSKEIFAVHDRCDRLVLELLKERDPVIASEYAFGDGKQPLKNLRRSTVSGSGAGVSATTVPPSVSAIALNSGVGGVSAFSHNRGGLVPVKEVFEDFVDANGPLGGLMPLAETFFWLVPAAMQRHVRQEDRFRLLTSSLTTDERLEFVKETLEKQAARLDVRLRGGRLLKQLEASTASS
uniref:Uncharacterized protein n=1 Tax=Chromera velia CCMP2878 TaxID=1169474 RepID=A0A0G4FLS0_9ALVE|eukprot:Cvel_17590.t1-p1 / transcript=Cvel_17590.t1 / gene=Cvel_17590 / organism=Chromera_velia_CCMP2878 / gene_product=hypothetical protein / transcript_product=hypothetical protein / location=Cvel_scaffold1414:36229-39075(-) / protein_length=364 / sequence_SO=supercontig / SO=protein_coding / is_pseudo=false